jgi:uncharacterized membrane protein YgdD (TMEM256/DUF423 family)
MPGHKLFLVLGGLNALLAVALGAFGAHALKASLSAEMLSIYQTGVQYHFYHALGLILIGLVAAQMPQSGWVKWSGGLMLAGIVLFSGSLYILSITGARWLGAITPVGGIAFILAWFMFAVAVVRAP